MEGTTTIAELSAAHFAPERLENGAVRVFAAASDATPVTAATVEKVVLRPQGGLPDAPHPAFSAFLLFEPQFVQPEADVWLAGADWGPVGPLHIVRILPVTAPGSPVRFQLIRN